LCERLLLEGWHVACVDNLSTGAESNLAQLRLYGRFAFSRGDVACMDAQPGQLRGHWDAVFHLASPASPKAYGELPVETLEAGSAGTRWALEMAGATDAVFVFASSSEIYGDSPPPQREPDWGHVNPVGPRSCYDEAKRFGEALTLAYARRHGTRVRIARIFNTYGPRMAADDGRVIPQFITQALDGRRLTIWGDGTRSRSFCYVSDMIEGLRRLALLRCWEPVIVNLGRPQEVSVLDLARSVMQLVGSECGCMFGPEVEDEPPRRVPDVSRAERLLGWTATVSLLAGLQKTVAWFQALRNAAPGEMAGGQLAVH